MSQKQLSQIQTNIQTNLNAVKEQLETLESLIISTSMDSNAIQALNRANNNLFFLETIVERFHFKDGATKSTL